MTRTYDDIGELEADLWSASDNLRASSKLTSSDYCLPVLGVIFIARQVFGLLVKESSTNAERKRLKQASKSCLTAGPRTATQAEVKIRVVNTLWARATAEPAWMAA